MSNLNDLTVDELQDLAAEADISGRSTMNKAELVEALSDTEEDVAPEPEEETVEESTPSPTYEELHEARVEMQNASDEASYWKRALDAAQRINTISHRDARVAEVQDELEAASERYTQAYRRFHDLRAEARA